MKNLIAIAFSLLFASTEIALASDQETNLDRANRALASFIEEPNTAAWPELNKTMKTLDSEAIAKLDQASLQTIQNIIDWALPETVSGFELGTFQFKYEENIKYSLIFLAMIKDRLHPNLKSKILNSCSLFRTWNKDEYPEVSAAIRTLYEHYEFQENFVPIWDAYLQLPLEEKVAFHIASSLTWPFWNRYIGAATLGVIGLSLAYSTGFVTFPL
jgi:hypothetical protein